MMKSQRIEGGQSNEQNTKENGAEKHQVPQFASPLRKIINKFKMEQHQNYLRLQSGQQFEEGNMEQEQMKIPRTGAKAQNYYLQILQQELDQSRENEELIKEQLNIKTRELEKKKETYDHIKNENESLKTELEQLKIQLEQQKNQQIDFGPDISINASGLDVSKNKKGKKKGDLLEIPDKGSKRRSSKQALDLSGNQIENLLGEDQPLDLLGSGGQDLDLDIDLNLDVSGAPSKTDKKKKVKPKKESTQKEEKKTKKKSEAVDLEEQIDLKPEKKKAKAKETNLDIDLEVEDKKKKKTKPKEGKEVKEVKEEKTKKKKKAKESEVLDLS